MSLSNSETIHALAYPLRFEEGRGRFAKTADYDRYVMGLVKQVLMTAPGQRLNRPGFGTPISQLLFSNITDEVADLVKAQIRRALNRWLGNVIKVDRVETRQPEINRFVVEVSYVVLATGSTEDISEVLTI